MSRRSKTRLTFSLTIDQPPGAKIPDVRQFIKDALLAEQKARNPDDGFKEVDLSTVKCHLTNKEVTYG